MDGQDAHPTRNSLFVERASSPLLTVMQDVSNTNLGIYELKNLLSAAW
jgi:hypothetical protein